MLSIKLNLAYSIKQIFSICFLLITFFSFSVFGQTQKTQEAQLLPANQIVERELSGGQTHKYLISLKANEFLQIRAEQKGAHIVVRLFDSNQRQLAEVDISNATPGFEKLLFIIEMEGEYEIQISALDEKAATGKYTLQWSRQIATEKNRSQINAKKLYEDGLKLLNKLETRSDGITKLEEALKLYQQIKDREGEGYTLNVLGNAVLRYLAQYEKARDYYEQTLVIKREIKDRRGEGVTLNNLGAVYYNLAQYEKAKDYYEQALVINREIKNRRGESVMLTNLGMVYKSLAQYEKARDYYKQALIIDRETKSRRIEGRTLNNLGIVYKSLAQYEEAVDYLEQALIINRETKDRRGEGDTLDSLGEVYKSLAQYEKAKDYYEQALIISREINDRWGEGYTLNNLGEVYDKLAQYEKARQFYEQGSVISREIKDRSTEAETYSHLLLLLSKRLNIPNLAIFYGKQAVNIYQEIRADIEGLDPESQKSFLKDKEPTYRYLADILISEGRFPEAQAVLDLLKEEEFKKIVLRNGEPLFTIPYSRAEDEAIKIVDRLTVLGRELSDLKAKPKDSLTREQIKRLSEIESVEIPAANKELRQAIEALSTVEPDVKNVLDLRMKDNIQNILPALGKGVVALYTVIGKTTADDKNSNNNSLNKGKNKTDNNKTNNQKINIGWILLVTPEFYKAYPIDTADLEQTVFKFREALRSPAYDPQPVAQELYKKLFLQNTAKQKTTLAVDLETYLAREKDKTLMWSLDGVLRYVPMAALHDGKGYLVEKYRNVVFNTASLGSLKDTTKKNWEVVGLGVSNEETVVIPDGRMVRFLPLPGSESELNSIIKEKNSADAAGVFPGTLKINNDFTREALFEGARTGMPVIHISSHFWFDFAKQETSFLLLGNGGSLEVTEFQDYPNLFSNVDFLSLSACNTATAGKAETDEKARESNGKEIEGFAYVAQTLGAKSVMASLGQVSDQVTMKLMLKFYQIKKKQPELPKGEALRQAQLSLLRGTNKAQKSKSGAKELVKSVREEHTGVAGLKPFKKDKKAPFGHPYYWSPFILIGNWR